MQILVPNHNCPTYTTVSPCVFRTIGIRDLGTYRKGFGTSTGAPLAAGGLANFKALRRPCAGGRSMKALRRPLRPDTRDLRLQDLLEIRDTPPASR